MASPMRKKRAWSTREDDAESKETAAFEASVAAAKDIAAESGAFLSTAKEDLTDHQRWLHAQSVAVERDRMRHERWLQRQRDHRLSLARRERTKRRRQLMRQRAFRAIQQAVWAGVLFISTVFLLVFAKIFAGVKFVTVSIWRAIAWVGAQLGAFVLLVARAIAAAARWTGAKLKTFGLWLGRMLSAGAAWSGTKAQSSARVGGRAIATGSAFVSRKAVASAHAGGSALAAGSRFAASKAGVFGRAAGRSLGSGLALASVKGGALADATGRSAVKGFDVLSEKASDLAAACKRGIAAGYAWSKVRVLALAPALYVRIAKLGRQAERYARAGAVRAERVFEDSRARASAATASEAYASGSEIEGPEAQTAPAAELYGPFYEGFWVGGVSPNEPRAPAAETVAPRVRTKNALSIWTENARARALLARTAWDESALAQTLRARTRGADLSQMMIIAGTVLLVCGGLLIGGGLFLRAGAGPTPQAEEETTQGIAWSFEELDRPLPERAVFTLSGTPASFRINGLSLGGINQSDQPLTSMQGVLKPDVQRPDLKLTLQVDKRASQAGEGDTEAQSLDIVPRNTVPPHAPFRLVFAFPPEAMDGEDGITVEDYFESYGGLLLKLRFEVEGKERTLIQYLPPDMLRGQLDEVSAGAGG